MLALMLQWQLYLHTSLKFPPHHPPTQTSEIQLQYFRIGL